MIEVRATALATLSSSPHFDLAVIGGGATGCGVALDAAARGFSVVLLEAEDFAKGTSSRATKLVHGGVKYWDGQFDDARLAIALARTAASKGAVVLNHCAVTSLLREGGKVVGVTARDAIGGADLRIAARCVVNATGVWVDAVRDMDREEGTARKPGIVAPSQGVHLVVDRTFLPGTHALLVPKTEDGRVLFAVPWLGKTILGTTDTPRDDVVREPTPFKEEVEFILRESARYLAKAPTRADVRSVWVGLRPLVKAGGDDDGENTKALSREHTVLVGRSGLVTVTGGKWTTYRAMAEDVLDRCFDRALLPRRAAGVTVKLPLVGAPQRAAVSMTAPPGEHLYGEEAVTLRALPGADRWLWRDGEGGLSEAMVRFAARHEMALSVEDVLARRCRLLFLDAAEAQRQAGAVAKILAEELGPSFDAPVSQAAFETLAQQYQRLP